MTAKAQRQPLWRRLIGFNLLSGIVLGIVGFYVGWWLGHQIHADQPRPSSRTRTRTTSR